jgi:uracil DNA glycosylase superfamily protein
MAVTFADRVLAFHRDLALPKIRVRGVKALDPYRNPVTSELAARFYHKYYADSNPRIFIFGINPGRFGAGMTGVPFTDPIRLQHTCGIENDLPKKQELSSVFIYKIIERWGGAESFYKAFFFAAVSPVGFVRDGKNFNYYDDTRLLRSLQPFIVESMRKQIEIGARRQVAILLGTGRNRLIFERLNEEHGFFGRVLVVEHPRFIMQYRRKRLDEYVDRYHGALTQAVGDTA